MFKNISKKKILSSAILIALLFLPLVFIFLPADYFDTGQTLCPSKRFLDIECLGCGLTRGIQHLIHLDFETAWQFNKLSPFIMLVIMFYWVKLFLEHFRIVFPPAKQ